MFTIQRYKIKSMIVRPSVQQVIYLDLMGTQYKYVR